MSDYNSSLPIRTESDGDAVVKICDATTTTQQLKVNADGSIDTNFPVGSKIIITDGSDDLAVNADGSINAVVTATDLDIRDLTATDVVTVVQTTHDNLNANVNLQVGDADVANGNPVPISDAGGSITVDGTVAATQSGTWDIGTVTQITNDVNIADGGNSITVDAVDLDIRDLSASSDSVAAHLFDEAGNAFSLTNPLPVELVSDQSGDEVVSYNTSASVASDASVNHDYTVTAAKTFLGDTAWVSGSGKLKVELLVNGATKYVGFNSTSNPNIEIPLNKILKGAATQVIRMTITNRDNQAQDVYSTLSGLEV